MTTAPATHTTQTIETKGDFGPTLAQETRDLDALHTGVVRHLAAWRDAHEAAVFRLGAVMARMDAIIERIERRHRQA